jgi:hypothetical protein
MLQRHAYDVLLHIYIPKEVSDMGYDKLGYCGWWILKTVFFVFACFVFSIIFWATKNWLEKGSSKKKKK